MRKPLVLAISVCLIGPGCVTEKENGPVEEPRLDPAAALIKEYRENPEDYELNMRMGWHFYLEKNYNRARVHFEYAIDRVGRREYTGPHYRLGLTYMAIGEYEKALEEFEDCYRVPQEEYTYRLDDFYRLSQLRSAEIYAKHLKEPEKAIEHLSRFHQMGGNLDDERPIFLEVARIYAFDREEPEKAETYLEKYRALGGSVAESGPVRRKIQALREKASSGPPPAR